MPSGKEVTSFEIKFIFLKDLIVSVICFAKFSISTAKAFPAGKTGQIILNLEDFSAENNATYLKVSIRPLTELNESVSVWLNGVNGYSDEYDDDALANAIKLERLRSQNDVDSDSNEKSGNTMIWTLVAVGIAMIAIGTGLFIVLKREEETTK